MDATQIVNAVTPVLVPLIIAGFKKLLPEIPSVLLPLIAVLLGIVGGVITQYATGLTGNIWLSALLGIAGVGVRELVDQMKQQVQGDVHTDK